MSSVATYHQDHSEPHSAVEHLLLAVDRQNNIDHIEAVIRDLDHALRSFSLSSVRKMMREGTERMMQILAFLVVFGTANAALFGLPWPTLLIGALTLSAISLAEHRRYRARFAAVGMSDVFQTFAVSNSGASLIACVGAYALGSLVRLVVF